MLSQAKWLTLRIAPEECRGYVTELRKGHREATAHDAEVQMLLASVVNWQPRHSAFAGLFGANDRATPSAAMSFSPGLLGLLSDARSDDQT